MRLAANNTNNISLNDIEWIIQDLFGKYTKQLSKSKLPKRPENRVESEFQQRMELLNLPDTSLRIGDNANSIIEMACHLDSIEDVQSGDLLTREMNQQLSSARKYIAESLGLEAHSTWDKISRSLYIEHDFGVKNIVPKQVGDIIAANDNCSPIESLKNKNALDVIGILRLIGSLSGIQAPNREIFLKELKRLDHQGKLEPEIYARKYKLTLILRIPEISTWEMIFSKLEEKYPEIQWTEKAA